MGAPKKINVRRLAEEHRHRFFWIVLLVVLTAVEYAVGQAKEYVWARIVGPEDPDEDQPQHG